MSKVKVIKITKKGQITVPAEYRKKLKNNVVEVYIEDEKLVIKPVQELGGILHQYAIKDKPIDKIMEMENKIASKALLDRYEDNS